jgi:hypothetical protein
MQIFGDILDVILPLKVGTTANSPVSNNQQLKLSFNHCNFTPHLQTR